MKMTKQQEKVYRYILAHRGCTTHDIMRDTFVQCPSGRISELRQLGANIISVGQKKYEGSKAFEMYAIKQEEPAQLSLIKLDMREIKFRAWDAEKKQMRDVTAINWYDEYLWVDETPMTGDKLPIEGTPLLQFTGLHDKNGKEIYEGDILWRGENQFHKPFEVKIEEFYNSDWEDSTFGFGFSMSTISPEDFKNEMEVIGNIYESPELINT